MNSVTFKIVHGSNISRISVDPSLEFSGFLARVKESVPNPDPMFWVDEEGDRINLVGPEDYQEALNFLKNQTKYSALRLYVEETKSESDIKDMEGEETEPEEKKPESGPVVHGSVICNECASQVVGHRFKCTVCWDFDLCDDCHGKGVHPEEHVMLVIKKPIAPFPFHRAGYPCHRHEVGKGQEARELRRDAREARRLERKESREARKQERAEKKAEKKAERLAKKEARKGEKPSETSESSSESEEWESDAPPYEEYHHHHGHHHHHHHGHHHHFHHGKGGEGKGKGKGCVKGMWDEEDHQRKGCGKGFWGKGWGKGKGCWGKGKWAFVQEAYAPQVEALAQMGFNDTKKNMRLLWKCDGDVDAVVAFLTRMKV